MYTRNFRQLSIKDIRLAGGKGASLGEMTQAGIPVPSGFVVLSTAFDRFLKDNIFSGAITTQLRQVKYHNPKTVKYASQRIQKLIMNGVLSENLSQDIRISIKRVQASRLAIRSSATAEDSSFTSWAGELESYLNISPADATKKVRECWASLFSPRAIFYRFDNQLQHTDISVAVVVQTMVPSEVAGVCFTVHPMTKNRRQMVIEAGWGLGEALVSGMITPDSYVVNKGSWKILHQTISDQETMIARTLNGTSEKRVPSKKRLVRKLSAEQIVVLAKLANKIERHYGKPQDIEWALNDGKFYILQSRPITTL